ncbi:hypothetical protein FPRO03_14018 [Fusarium proliferatum]|nr:hypothetical protein FPRO03_14018 [Fusarium proliferatum]
MSAKLAKDFAAFQTVEEGQSARLQDADKARSKIEELQQSMERSSFVLVLIDADADPYIFKDEYYAAGDGGRKASLALRDGVRSFLQTNRPEQANYPILIKAYANELGLSQFLVARGVIKAPRDLVEFAKDFTQALENTDFVLVGSGKDRADKKIQDGKSVSSRTGAEHGAIATAISIRFNSFDLGIYGRLKDGCGLSEI